MSDIQQIAWGLVSEICGEPCTFKKGCGCYRGIYQALDRLAAERDKLRDKWVLARVELDEAYKINRNANARAEKAEQRVAELEKHRRAEVNATETAILIEKLRGNATFAEGDKASVPVKTIHAAIEALLEAKAEIARLNQAYRDEAQLRVALTARAEKAERNWLMDERNMDELGAEIARLTMRLEDIRDGTGEDHIRWLAKEGLLFCLKPDTGETK